MTTIDDIRDKLIGRIMATENIELLKAIDHILESLKEDETAVHLHPSRIKMLELSEKDIQHGILISEEELDKMDEQWLS